MSTTLREPALGDTIGPYRITRLIGRGRMGVVFEATGEDGQAVAVKVMTDELARHDVFLRRFEREQRIAQQISHPNVVAVLDYGQHSCRPYLVTRLITGGSLADRLAARGTLGLDATLTLVRPVAAGIDALHATGLVHRDIQPANILLDEADRPYLVDFGLARSARDETLTRPGQALGTLDYMAPEQIRGERAIPATDIYALGCVVWECLTGTPPFGGRPSMRALFAHLHEPVPELPTRRADIAPAVGRAVNRALEKEAVSRPATAGAYVADIARVAGLA